MEKREIQLSSNNFLYGTLFCKLYLTELIQLFFYYLEILNGFFQGIDFQIKNNYDFQFK